MIAQTARLQALSRLHPGGGRLKSLENFGSNPGALLAKTHVPENLPPGAPLVVVLHGCTQNAGGYDRCSGWSGLADAHGFALLFPEQQRANNFNLCFNWFERGDARRDAGEPLSIVQMIETMAARHGIDRDRVFVTGLSAGGAMTAVLLATYPEVFAGGAIIAGLPFASAASVPDAFMRMQGGGRQSATDLARLVRAASPHDGDWPRLSVWHGTADNTVAPSNMTAIVETWLEVQGLGGATPRHEIVDGHERKAWRDAAGREVVEAFEIIGMGHGVPLSTTGAESAGEAGPHMLEAGISSTHHIARFWGIIGDRAEARAQAPRPASIPALGSLWQAPAMPPAGNRIADIINNALRAAGLQR